MQTQLHRDPEYGVASVHYAPMVAQVIKASVRRSFSITAQAKVDWVLLLGSILTRH